MTEDEMVGCHNRLPGHKFEQVPGVGDRQGSLVCCSPRGLKELDMTWRMNNNNDLQESSSGPDALTTQEQEVTPKEAARSRPQCCCI